MGSGNSRVQNIKKLKGHWKSFTFIGLPWNHSCSYQWAPAFQCAKQCSFCDYMQGALALWQVLTVTTKRLHDRRIVFWQVSYKNARPYVFQMEMHRGRKEWVACFKRRIKYTRDAIKRFEFSVSFMEKKMTGPLNLGWTSSLCHLRTIS